MLCICALGQEFEEVHTGGLSPTTLFIALRIASWKYSKSMWVFYRGLRRAWPDMIYPKKPINGLPGMMDAWLAAVDVASSKERVCNFLEVALHC